MRYTMIATPEAENGLTLAWLYSKDRDAVTIASGVIGNILAKNPHQGINCEYCWLLRIPPLEVLYTLSEDDRLVRIFSVDVIQPGS